LRATNVRGETAAHFAARGGHDRELAAISELVGCEALHARSLDGRTPAHLAAENGHNLKTILVLGGPGVLSAVDNNGTTPELYALQRRKSSAGVLETAIKQFMKFAWTFVPGQAEWKVFKKLASVWLVYQMLSLAVDELQARKLGTRVCDVVGIIIPTTCGSCGWMLAFFVATPVLACALVLALLVAYCYVMTHHSLKKMIAGMYMRLVALLESFIESHGVLVFTCVNLVLWSPLWIWQGDIAKTLLISRRKGSVALFPRSNVTMPCLDQISFDEKYGFDDNRDGNINVGEAVDIFGLSRGLSLLGIVMPPSSAMLMVLFFAEAAVGVVVYLAVFFEKGRCKKVVAAVLAATALVLVTVAVEYGKALCAYTMCLVELDKGGTVITLISVLIMPHLSCLYNIVTPIRMVASGSAKMTAPSSSRRSTTSPRLLDPRRAPSARWCTTPS
jgi:hypothetical protein